MTDQTEGILVPPFNRQERRKHLDLAMSLFSKINRRPNKLSAENIEANFLKLDFVAAFSDVFDLDGGADCFFSRCGEAQTPGGVS